MRQVNLTGGLGMDRPLPMKWLIALALIVELFAASPASAGGLGLAPGSPFSTGGIYPAAVAVGDFNGDGRLDALFANKRSGNVSMLLGNGLGGLSPAPGSPFPTGAPLYPASLAVGDLTGDGHLDAVVANTSGSVSLLIGDGRGGLKPAPGSPFPTGGLDPESLALGDFNGDGNLDVAIANTKSGDVSVLLGDGHGGLRPAPGSPFATGGSRPASLAVGDFNGDGRLDVAVANQSSGDVSLLLGDGQGRLRPATGSAFATGGFRPVSLAAGDFNGDGRLDVAVANQSSGDVSLLLGDGHGGLRPAPGSPFATGGFHPVSLRAADLNGDGRLDVVAANLSGEVSVLLGDGHGTLTPATGSPFEDGGFHPISVALGDFNGDGKPDVVAANASSDDASVLLNGGPAIASTCAISPRPLTVSSGGVVGVRVTCPFRAIGTLVLSSAPTAKARGGHSRKGRRGVLAKRGFKIRRAGATALVKLRLSSKARRRVTQSRKLQVVATIVARRAGARSPVTRSTQAITLEGRTKKRH